MKLKMSSSNQKKSKKRNKKLIIGKKFKVKSDETSAGISLLEKLLDMKHCHPNAAERKPILCTDGNNCAYCLKLNPHKGDVTKTKKKKKKNEMTFWICEDCRFSHLPKDLQEEAKAKLAAAQAYYSSRACFCGSCPAEDKSGNESKELQEMEVCWSNLRHFVHYVYLEVMSRDLSDVIENCPYDEQVMKQHVKQLMEADAHNLFLNLESVVREFILEVKVGLVKQLKLCQNEQFPAIHFITLLLASFQCLCRASKIVAVVLQDMDENHLKKHFSVTWEILVKTLFHSIIYSDPLFSNILPLIADQLKLEVTTCHLKFAQDILTQYCKFEKIMSVVCSIAANTRQLLERYNEEQAAYRAKEQMLREDWEFFRAQRKLLEQRMQRLEQRMMTEEEAKKKEQEEERLCSEYIRQFLTERNRNRCQDQKEIVCERCNMKRCPCDECSIQHMITCGIIDPNVLPPSFPHNPKFFHLDSSSFILDVNPPSLSSGSSSGSSCPSPITMLQEKFGECFEAEDILNKHPSCEDSKVPLDDEEYSSARSSLSDESEEEKKDPSKNGNISSNPCSCFNCQKRIEIEKLAKENEQNAQKLRQETLSSICGDDLDLTKVFNKHGKKAQGAPRGLYLLHHEDEGEEEDDEDEDDDDGDGDEDDDDELNADTRPQPLSKADVTREELERMYTYEKAKLSYLDAFQILLNHQELALAAREALEKQSSSDEDSDALEDETDGKTAKADSPPTGPASCESDGGGSKSAGSFSLQECIKIFEPINRSKFTPTKKSRTRSSASESSVADMGPLKFSDFVKKLNLNPANFDFTLAQNGPQKVNGHSAETKASSKTAASPSPSSSAANASPSDSLTAKSASKATPISALHKIAPTQEEIKQRIASLLKQSGGKGHIDWQQVSQLASTYGSESKLTSDKKPGITINPDRLTLEPKQCKDSSCRNTHDYCSQLGDSDDDSEISSTASSTNQGRETKQCECRYCELFGHGTGTTSRRNEIRDRLRNKLERKKSMEHHRSHHHHHHHHHHHRHHDNENNDTRRTKHSSGTPDVWSVDALVKFINGEEEEAPPPASLDDPSNGDKKAKKKLKKSEKKARQRMKQIEKQSQPPPAPPSKAVSADFTQVLLTAAGSKSSCLSDAASHEAYDTDSISQPRSESCAAALAIDAKKMKKAKPPAANGKEMSTAVETGTESGQKKASLGKKPSRHNTAVHHNGTAGHLGPSDLPNFDIDPALVDALTLHGLVNGNSNEQAPSAVLDEVFVPKNEEELNQLDDDFEKELEAFKRFCWETKPSEKREKVHVNVDVLKVMKKKGSAEA